MSNGYFEFWKLTSDGDEYGESIQCRNDVAVCLQSHPQAIVVDILHLCEIARTTPGYPVDLSAWRVYDVTIDGETHEQKSLLWNARIYWRIQ